GHHWNISDHEYNSFSLDDQNHKTDYNCDQFFKSSECVPDPIMADYFHCLLWD
ncbi:Hypothetical predicted protein, partial [Marmota monax]